MINIFQTLLFVIVLLQTISAQDKCQNFIIQDNKSKELLIGASILQINTGNGVLSDATGKATLCKLSTGSKIAISFIGYEADTVIWNSQQNQEIIVNLNPSTSDIEEVIITSTRTNSRIEDAAAKIEVLGAEDMAEENGIKPGNVASILGDISSIQIQQSSAISGNAAVRMYGLDSKYTQLLRDGMPAFDGFSGGFGILQVAPLDLKQVEIIKGSSSTLYGGGAIGGIINFVSKSPTEKPEGALTLNLSSLGESNINAFYSKKFDKIGFTIFADNNRQIAKDVDEDGFSDLAKSLSITLHPRLFLHPNQKTDVMIGTNLTYNTIRGGDMIAIIQPTLEHPYYEQNKMFRTSIETQINRRFENNKNNLQFKAMFSKFQREQLTKYSAFQGQQQQLFSELSYVLNHKNDAYVFGVNDILKSFINQIDPTLFPNNYQQHTIGAFAQGSNHFGEKLTLESGLRLDYNLQYGAFVLPSAALLYKWNNDFLTRLNVGLGYQLPDPLASQIQDFDITQIHPISDTVVAEKAFSSAVEWSYHHIFHNNISLFVDQTFFAINVQKPIIATENANQSIDFVNASGNTNTIGVDNYIRLSIPKWELYLGYTFTLPKKTYEKEQSYIIYTPLHRAASTLVYEPNEDWRFGLESSLTGKQYREDGTLTKAYLFMAAMIQYNYKKCSFVLNGENLLDARQTRYESIVNPPFYKPTFKTLWAPIDGRMLNISVVWHF